MKHLIGAIILIISFTGCATKSGKTSSDILPEENIIASDVALVENDDFSDMRLSEKYFDWQNPTTGGALHINQHDEIELYQSFTWWGSKEKRYFESISLDDKDFHLYISGIGFGNAPSVLLTSEIDVNISKNFRRVIDKMNESGYNIYCLHR
ncbi:MAG: hypothetical protein AAGI38_21090 [Bacteroidota bacterium]